MTPTFPDETTDGFPSAPRTFTDGEGREILVERVGPEVIDALAEMYSDFESEDRAQGIPPATESAITDWLDNVVTEESLNVIARLDEEIVGHAMLVPDASGGYELAIFVLREYQGAGIGTELVESLLGWAQEEAIEKVWLTVERWNDPAIRLYENVGFETTDRQSFELEMALRLATSD